MLDAKNYELIAKSEYQETKKAREDVTINFPFVGRLPNDIFVKVVHFKKKGGELMLCRFGINTALVPFNDQRGCFCTILDKHLVDPDKIKTLPEWTGF